MADHAALHEARAILDLATGLMARINAEIAALEKAQRLAEESLARVEATAAATVAFVGTLGEGLRQGRRMQEETIKMLGEGARVQTALRDRVLSTVLEPPALASAALQPAAPFQPAPAVLPDFAMAGREELWRGELASSPRTDLWDVLAAGVKTHRDLQEEALERLDAAERELAQATERKSRRRKAADRADREEREHE